MKNMTRHSAVALLLGAAGMYVYFALIGVVSFLSAKQGMHKWVFSLPKSLQETAILAHYGIEELIASLTDSFRHIRTRSCEINQRKPGSAWVSGISWGSNLLFHLPFSCLPRRFVMD